MKLFREVEALLRGDGSEGGPPRSWGRVTATIIIFGFLFGAVMGASNLRGLQCLFSGIKVPLLLAFSTLVCLPNFFIVTSLLGLRSDFRYLLAALWKAQATVAIMLAALSPLTLLVYASIEDYALAVVWNGLLFLLATAAGQYSLSRSYAPLVAVNPRHRIAKRAWLILYAFVSIQLAWVLRPFIGFAGLPTRFFRESAWDNAYVVVLRTLWDLLSTSLSGE